MQAPLDLSNLCKNGFDYSTCTAVVVCLLKIVSHPHETVYILTARRDPSLSCTQCLLVFLVCIWGVCDYFQLQLQYFIQPPTCNLAALNLMCDNLTVLQCLFKINTVSHAPMHLQEKVLYGHHKVLLTTGQYTLLSVTPNSQGSPN